MIVSEVEIIPIKASEGLVAFATCVINGELFLGSLGVHKRLDGTGYRVTYPTKRLGLHELNYYHPLSKEAGLAIQNAVNARCIELFEKSDDTNDRHNQIAAKHSRP